MSIIHVRATCLIHTTTTTAITNFPSSQSAEGFVSPVPTRQAVMADGQAWRLSSCTDSSDSELTFPTGHAMRDLRLLRRGWECSALKVADLTILNHVKGADTQDKRRRRPKPSAWPDVAAAAFGRCACIKKLGAGSKRREPGALWPPMRIDILTDRGLVVPIPSWRGGGGSARPIELDGAVRCKAVCPTPPIVELTDISGLDICRVIPPAQKVRQVRYFVATTAADNVLPKSRVVL